MSDPLLVSRYPIGEYLTSLREEFRTMSKPADDLTPRSRAMRVANVSRHKDIKVLNANLFTAGAIGAIGACFTLEAVIPPDATPLAATLIFAPPVLIALWKCALADLWFDYVTFPRLATKPLSRRDQEIAETFLCSRNRMELIRISSGLASSSCDTEPLPIITPDTPRIARSSSATRLPRRTPLVVSTRTMRKALTMADQSGTENATSEPCTLNAFTSHEDPELYSFLMQIALSYDVTVEQMDDLSPSGHIQVRFHAFGDNAASRISTLVQAVRNPVNLDDPVALQNAIDAAAPNDPPIIAQSTQRLDDAAATAAQTSPDEPANPVTDVPSSVTATP